MLALGINRGELPAYLCVSLEPLARLEVLGEIEALEHRSETFCALCALNAIVVMPFVPHNHRPCLLR